MIPLLTADSLNAETAIRFISPKIREQGVLLYKTGAATVQRVDPGQAWLSVSEPNRPYNQVRFWINGSFIYMTCRCYPYGSQTPSCRHLVAGLLTLRDYLTEHPQSVWRVVLNTPVPPKKGKAGYRGRLVFSLQMNTYQGWTIHPYSIELGDDAETATSDDLRLMLSTVEGVQRAKRLKQQATEDLFPGTQPDVLLAANMFLPSAQPGYYYNAYNNTMSPHVVDSALRMIAGEVAYTGDNNQPFSHSVRITAATSKLALRIDEVENALRLRAMLKQPSGSAPLAGSSAQTIIPNPAWILAYDCLQPFDDPSGLASWLFQYPELTVPKREQEEFFDNYLIPLVERLPVEGEFLQWQEIATSPEPRIYLAEIANGEVEARLRFGYDEYEVEYDKSRRPYSVVRAPGTTTLLRVQRAAEREAERWVALPSFGLKKGTEPGQMLLRKNVNLVDFLLHQVPKLVEAGYSVFGEETLTSARINRAKPKIQIFVSSGIDWFDLQAVVTFGDVELPLKDLRRAIRRRERFVKLADGSIGVVPEEWIARFRHLFALAEEEGDGLRLSTLQVSVVDQLLTEVDESKVDAAFGEKRERLRGFESIRPVALPVGFQGELRPYQKAGFDWLHFLHDYELGGCLADDMGTGKTIQTLAFLQSLKESGQATSASLIVMPRSLLFNWRREAERFAPDLRVYAHHEKSRFSDPNAFGDYDLVITTYGTMLRDIELLRGYQFHYAILDEAQWVKNPLAETAKAARLLKADHRLALTGTPVENSTIELWSLFAFLNPGLLGNFENFRSEFVQPLGNESANGALGTLRQLVFPFILRRTKDQVATDLPPRTERVLITEMEPAQRKVYEKTRQQYRELLLGMIDDGGMNQARLKILEGLLRLRQICNHPAIVDASYRGKSAKFELLFETLETLRAEGHKALVFSQFVQTLKLIRAELDHRKIRYAYLDGSTKDRQEVVDQFQSDGDLPFFLISLKAGGVGLNLTAADYVIHVDPWWNPAVEMQAADRTHRIGQDKPVFVTKLVVSDTVEEKILLLQERKRELVSQLITSDTSVFKSLSRDDIAALFN